MPVKINTLWNNAKFIKLSNNAKLLYLYLISNNSIDVVGVIQVEIPLVQIQLSLDYDSVKEASKELVENEYIRIKKYDSILYFVVPNHFKSIPKTDESILKVNKALEALPLEVRLFLKDIGIDSIHILKQFEKPTAEEIALYAEKMGYVVNGNTVVDYYETCSRRFNIKDYWVDGNGKRIKDWKMKLMNVWFKENNKLSSVFGAPKGYEYFSVNMDGKLVYPEAWKDGKPTHKDFLISKALNQEYDRRTKNST